MAFSPETYALLRGQGGGGGGSDLPSVTAADNGKVLSVVDGAWATDNILYDVNQFENTLNKTWAEILSALQSGKIARILQLGEDGAGIGYIDSVYTDEEFWFVHVLGVNGWYQASSASGYPEYYED